MAKKPAAEKKPREPKAAKPKTTKDKAAKPAGKKFNSPVNETDKALFLQTLPKIAKARDDIAKATNHLRTLYKVAKKDGFLKSDFDTAFAIQGAEGEKNKKAAIARDLTIAKWLGCDLGSQLDLFVQDERVPAADRAWEEGQAASMKGETAKPNYAPSTEQYRKYMEGYHHDQENRIKKGIKPTPEGETTSPGLITKAQKDAAAKAEAEKKASAGAGRGPGPRPDAPTSGVSMSRADFKKQQADAAAKAKADAEKLFDKTGAGKPN